MYRQLKRKRQWGSAMLEFTLVGIPLIFIWISVAEMARGMWQYHTLQYATKVANAYAATHGATCGWPNTCSVNVSDVVGVFKSYGFAVPMDQVTLTLKSTTAANTVTCAPVTACSSNSSWSTRWPPPSNGDNAVGKAVAIQAEYRFSTALSMFWPGAGRPSNFGSAAGAGKFYFPGYSYQMIQF